jgi:hypothetical protein
MRTLPALAVLCALHLGAPALAQGQRRFALVVGNDDGGPGTRPLRYAHEDARRIFDVLHRLGEVRDGDASLLLEKTADDLRRAIGLVESRMKAALSGGERSVLVVYYSGHARDGALRMGKSALPLEELKGLMRASAAEVRIGLFDSCRSGAITRSKGARRAPAFEVDAGTQPATRGLVVLTSSAADEDSQESDELSGSYFSHHLASGLLGAADNSGDGRVSLGEAYAYAYERTVADTAGTAAGPQHPTFSYDLAGNGDVILTDLARRREGVLLSAGAPPGSWFLVDGKGAVAAEIAKAAGVERRIALAAGSYRVKRRLADRLRIGELRVPADATVVLDDAMLRDAPFSDDPVKGAARRYEPEARVELSLGGGWQGFFSGPFPSMPLLSAEVVLRDYLRADWELALDFAFGAGSTSLIGLDRLPYRFSELGFGVSLVREWPLGRAAPFLGGRLGAVALRRSFEADASVPKQGYFAMTPGLVFGLRFQLTRSWSLTGRARIHYLYYNVDSPQSLGYLEGSLGLSYEL